MRSERPMKRILLSTLALVPALLLALLAIPAAAAAAGPITTSACTGSGTVACSLWAATGSLAVPGGSVTIWGYSDTSGGSPTLPGPTLVVTQGDTVTLTLTNNLPQATSLVIEGLDMAPDLASVASGASHSYSFTAAAPGTYLYEAGIVPGTEYQAAMGLYGALIVRPAGAPGQAYGDAGTSFGDEALIVAAEIDPALSNAASPQSFDVRTFAPKYFLVNGRAFTNATSSITVTAGNTLLLRYANAGIQHHSLGVLGLHQRVIAADGSQLPAPRTMIAETLAPGQTADVLISLPATTAASTKYPVYDAAQVFNNSNQNPATSGIGGMLVMLDAIAGDGGPDTVGPITSSVSASIPAAGDGSVTASVSDAATGNANVAAAEYFVDSVGANGTGTAMSGTFGTPTVAVNATIAAATIGALSSGSHTIYVHGQDSLGNWGSPSSTTFTIDRTGPAVSALTLSPNPSNGSVTVALAGTASDAASGNGNVTAAEYTVDGGTAAAMSLNKTAPTVSITATIPSGLAAGTHTVAVRAQDAAGNWGAPTSIDLVVDNQGPATSAITANPPANNGSIGQSSSNPSVRITATLDDTGLGGQRIAAGEGFIDTVGATGTGFPFTATDGAFSSPRENVYADIPLTTINLLTPGNHVISVRGKDAVGNWGATASLTYLIDKTAPTFAGLTAAPNPVIQGTNLAVTVQSPVDPLVGGLASGLARGEYWIDATTAPAPGTATSFTLPTAAIPTGSLAVGSHTVGVRIRDNAGNWSTAASTTFSVVPDVIFSNGFETGNRPWGWTSASTNTTSRLNVTTSPALVGTRSLQAQGNNTNYVQYNWGAATNPAWPTFDARFYFRPNGNTSTGQDILVAASNTSFAAASQLVHVRYRINAGTPQVQIQVGVTANATWTNILGGTGNNVIEVVWQSGTSLQLYVNGTLADTVTTATTGSITAVRLGSVTSGGNATLEYFDAFAAKRTVSPLVGP